MAVYPVAYSEFPIPPSSAYPQGRTARRPILQISLISGTNRLSCYAVVDSGADHCVFPRSFIQPLGLDVLGAPIELTSGMGSANVPTHFFNISIDLQNVVRIPVYAGFTVGLDQMGVGLLGQSGFFDRFNVHFKLQRGIYEIDVPWQPLKPTPAPSSPGNHFPTPSLSLNTSIPARD
ncbi:MAG: hypothetical protein WB995_17855 [Candidatus Acidiferrales bacterium]